MENSNKFPGESQEDIHAEIRTKGLTILARILAASLARKNPDYHKASGGQGSQIDEPDKSNSKSDTNDQYGGQH